MLQSQLGTIHTAGVIFMPTTVQSENGGQLIVYVIFNIHHPFSVISDFKVNQLWKDCHCQRSQYALKVAVLLSYRAISSYLDS